MCFQRPYDIISSVPYHSKSTYYIIGTFVSINDLKIVGNIFVLIFPYFLDQAPLVRSIGEIYMLVTYGSENLWVLLRVKSPCINKIEVKAGQSIMMTIQYEDSCNQTASYLYESQFSMKKGHNYLLPEARLPQIGENL